MCHRNTQKRRPAGHGKNKNRSEKVKDVRILSTKKLRPNQKTFLLNAGFSVTDADFISVDSRDFSLAEVKDNLIFTSANAVKAVANHPNVQQIRRNPCFCAGEKAAALLDEVGFTVVEIASDAASLGVM